jgi:hypothetical protein
VGIDRSQIRKQRTLNFLEGLVFLAIGHLAVRDSSRPACENLQGLSQELRGIREAALKLVCGENEDLAWDEGRDRGRPFPSSKPGDLTEKFPWLNNIHLLPSFAHGAATGEKHIGPLGLVALSKECVTRFNSAHQAGGSQASPRLVNRQHSVAFASRLRIADFRHRTQPSANP